MWAACDGLRGLMITQAHTTHPMAHPAFAQRTAENFAHTMLRGLAAMAVVGFHAIRQPEELAPGLGRLFQASYLCVDLFFVLSGFIMFETYAPRLRSGGFGGETLRFLRKRAAKILPNYYIWLFISMGLFVIIRLYFEGQTESVPCLGAALLHHMALVQHFTQTCAYFNTPLWSIATETFVYLLFPLLALMMRWWWLAALASLCLYAGIYASYDDIDLIDGPVSLVRTLAGFVAGGAIALLHRKIPDPLLHMAQLPAACALIASLAWGVEMAALGAIVLLVLATARNVGPLWRAAQWGGVYKLGRASFSIYLAHIPVMSILVLLTAKIETETGIALFTNWHIFVPICLIICGSIGVVAYMLIEHKVEARSQRPPTEVPSR